MWTQWVTSFVFCSTLVAATSPNYFNSRFYHAPQALTENKRAVVDLVAGGDSGVSGKLYLVGGYGHVHISGQVNGLKPGLHGFHVHMNGDLDNNCKAAGGHFNPDENDHSSPVSLARHAGDLGNIFTLYYSPVTYVSIIDKIITLGDGGERDVAGRAIVIHAGEDDLGRGVGDKAADSKKTGNAGARVACGIITLL
eukprot:GFUD01009012.1.p1 GENE.GFUD01009012.1~~GFUD01009012.1.p1  ORF type:complete len:196 (+),score=46.56 GFUD01009012.1:204-791(+)